MANFPSGTPEALALRRAAVRAACRPAEAAALAPLLGEAGLPADVAAGVADRARQLVAALRRSRHGASGVDTLMQEFDLSSGEGVALMCLAEALLRVPDRG